jgi:hypothetical protein
VFTHVRSHSVDLYPSVAGSVKAAALFGVADKREKTGDPMQDLLAEGFSGSAKLVQHRATAAQQMS